MYNDISSAQQRIWLFRDIEVIFRLQSQENVVASLSGIPVCWLSKRGFGLSYEIIFSSVKTPRLQYPKRVWRLSFFLSPDLDQLCALVWTDNKVQGHFRSENRTAGPRTVSCAIFDIRIVHSSFLMEIPTNGGYSLREGIIQWVNYDRPHSFHPSRTLGACTYAFPSFCISFDPILTDPLFMTCFFCFFPFPLSFRSLKFIIFYIVRFKRQFRRPL